jgi:non-heme chloroperoxidase
MKLIEHPNRYTAVPAPALFLFANPHGQGRWVDESTDPAVRKEAQGYSASLSEIVDRQIKAVKEALPEAQVVTIRGANHYVFLSNEAAVLRAMNAFLAGIK